jgi:hypothetical protein
MSDLCAAEKTAAHLDFVESARRCYQHASRDANGSMKGLFAEIALEYLRLAHRDAALVVQRRMQAPHRSAARAHVFENLHPRTWRIFA